MIILKSTEDAGGQRLRLIMQLMLRRRKIRTTMTMMMMMMMMMFALLCSYHVAFMMMVKAVDGTDDHFRLVIMKTRLMAMICTKLCQLQSSLWLMIILQSWQWWWWWKVEVSKCKWVTDVLFDGDPHLNFWLKTLITWKQFYLDSNLIE